MTIRKQLSNLIIPATALLASAAGLTAQTAQSADSTSSWLNAVSGDWEDDSFWDTTFFPNNGNGGFATHEAIINATGAPYTVTLNTNPSLDSLTIGSEDAELLLTPGMFLTVLNGMTLDGTVVIESNNFSNFDTMLRFSGSQTLGGTGRILFRKGGFNSTISVRPTNDEDVLTIGSGIEIRSDTTGGTVGHEQRGLINEGTIIANGQTIIVTGNNWSNTGLLKATNGGILRLDGTLLGRDLGSYEGTDGQVRYSLRVL